MGNSSGKNSSGAQTIPVEKPGPSIYVPVAGRIGLPTFGKKVCQEPFQRPTTSVQFRLDYASSNVPAIPPARLHNVTNTVNRQMYPSSNYDALSNLSQCRYVGVSMLPARSLQQTVEAPRPKVPDAHEIFRSWKTAYDASKTDSSKPSWFNARVNSASDEAYRKKEMETHGAYLRRVADQSKLYSEKVSLAPPLTLSSCLDNTHRLAAIRAYDEKYFSLKPKKPELTPAMLDVIKQACVPYPSDQLLVELDGAQVLRKDIQTLIGLNWLNDEVINAYMNLIVMRGAKPGFKKVYAFNTFFCTKLGSSGYSSVKRWTRKVDIFSYQFILVPVHLGNHWCLAVINFTTKTIAYYDSLGGGTNGCCEILLDYLQNESNDKKKQSFDDENWQLIDTQSRGIPQQRNCSDCGVFACTFAEYLTRDAKLDFSQDDMPYFRRKMIYEIISKGIL